MNRTTFFARPAAWRQAWATSMLTAVVLVSGCQQQDAEAPNKGAETTSAPAPVPAPSPPLQQSSNVPSLKPPQSGPALPDFGQISDVKTKKRAFFDYLQPMIEQENRYLIQLRQHFSQLQQLLEQQGELHPDDQKWLTQAARRYRADADMPAKQLKLLLAKVDQIPPALVKAQAANESGWGTSRFARQANNLFGQWCFTPGCGIAPLQRDADLEHEVQAFSSVAAGLRSYFINLNGNKSYASLRQIRRCLARQQQPATGRALAAGLVHYSARGGHYVEELQSMIRINQLEPWVSNWWGDTKLDHACYPLVQVEADHPDPVVEVEVEVVAAIETAIEIGASAATLSATVSAVTATSSAIESSLITGLTPIEPNGLVSQPGLSVETAMLASVTAPGVSAAEPPELIAPAAISSATTELASVSAAGISATEPSAPAAMSSAPPESLAPVAISSAATELASVSAAGISATEPSAPPESLAPVAISSAATELASVTAPGALATEPSAPAESSAPAEPPESIEPAAISSAAPEVPAAQVPATESVSGQSLSQSEPVSTELLNAYRQEPDS